MKPADQRALAGIEAELRRVVRYDDESIVNDGWLRQRYDCGCFPASRRPGRRRQTAWHEAGHAVAALAMGARFSSASIHTAAAPRAGCTASAEAGDRAFVVDAAGQIAERLRSWTMLERDEDMRAWLPTWGQRRRCTAVPRAVGGPHR